MSNIWDGTNLFIFEPWNICAGNIDQMISEIKSLGLTGVLIKFADGSLAGDPVSQQFMDNFKRIAPILKAAGIRVGGWIYQYLTDVAGEVDACSQAIESGAEWIVLDGEAEVYAKNAQVQQFGQMIRSKYPNIVIGLSSFAIASYHQQVPYAEYAAFVDVIMPQVYWADMEWDVNVAYTASVASYKKYGKPIAPTGQSYDAATQSDMATFVEHCKTDGITGISWYDFQHATQAHLDGIKANVIPVPVPVPVEVKTQPVADSAEPSENAELAKDVPADAWFAKAVEYVKDLGVMTNDENGNFNPNEPVTRAMLAQVIYNSRHEKG